MSWRAGIKQFNSFASGSRAKLLIFVPVFGLLGLLLLFKSQAATVSSSVEPENGTLAGAVSVVDSSASGGKAVKFGPTGGGTITCNLNATTANFASQLSAATAGQTVCLAAGNYGTWNGINKAITIAAQSGVTATLSLNIGTGDGNFTLNGLTIGGGNISGNSGNFGSADRPQNITIKNSTFTAALNIEYIDNANIMLDHNTHINIDNNSTCSSTPGRIHLSYSSNNNSGVTVQNSLLRGGNTDGVNAGSPLTILNNEFDNITEKSSNDCAHTDPIQLYGGHHMIIRGNYIHDSADGIVAYDGTHDNLIENNVIELVSGRWGLELYSDKNSIVRHNTLVYGTGCAYAPCGYLVLDHKSSDPAGSGTIIENNIATTVDLNNGSTASVNTKNMLRSGASGTNFNGIPVFVGGSAPTTWAGFKLAAGSPGIGAASDGGNVGIQ
jgi:hypothetical protein